MCESKAVVEALSERNSNKNLQSDISRGVDLRECRASILSRKQPPHEMRLKLVLSEKRNTGLCRLRKYTN